MPTTAEIYIKLIIYITVIIGLVSFIRYRYLIFYFMIPLLFLYAWTMRFCGARFPGWCETGDGILHFQAGLEGYEKYSSGWLFFFIILWPVVIGVIVERFFRLVIFVRRYIRDQSAAMSNFRHGLKTNWIPPKWVALLLLFWFGFHGANLYSKVSNCANKKWNPHWSRADDGSWIGRGYCVGDNGTPGHCPCMDQVWMSKYRRR
jgi:hypothetical protein